MPSPSKYLNTYLEVDEELDEGGACAVQHALCGLASLQTALVWKKRNAQLYPLEHSIFSYFIIHLVLGLFRPPRIVNLIFSVIFSKRIVSWSGVDSFYK